MAFLLLHNYTDFIYLQYLLILGLFIIINFQMIFVSFTINSKKIALKKYLDIHQ